MSESLEQVLIDEREAVAVLRAKGYGHDAAIIEKLLDRLLATPEMQALGFISEEEARLRSNKSTEWLRGQHATWLEEGMAKLEGRRRFYRRCVVPRRAHLSAAREAGLRGERSA